MKFSTRLTYALRMMVEINHLSRDHEPVSLGEVSRRTGISRGYLEQLTFMLKSEPLLEGVSGRYGGYRLSKPPDRIRILDIAKATIGPIQVTQCVHQPETCMRAEFCGCRKLWHLINLRINAVLNDYSLSDLSNAERINAIGQEIRAAEQRVELRDREVPDGAAALCPDFDTSPRRPPADRAQQSAEDGSGVPTGGRHGTDFSGSGRLDRGDYLETIRWLEDELRHKVDNPKASIPVDKKGAKVIYATNLREIKYMPTSLMAAAEIFHASGEDWTMTTQGWDSDLIFRDFLDNDVPDASDSEMVSGVKYLRAEKVVLSECGHSIAPSKWATMRNSAASPLFPVESFVQTVSFYLRCGRIRLDPSRNPDTVTYHDPCLLSRHYGITEEPRFLLTQAASQFREMFPNRSETWCCKGGGGIPTEYNYRRNEMDRIKVDQLLRTGAKTVATSCHNCIDGLNELVAEYNLDLKVKLVGEIVAEALVHG